MKEEDQDAKVITGALIGGIVGIGAITLFLALKRDKKTPLSTIGQAITHVGDVLENHEIQEPAPLKNLSKKIEKNENTFTEVIDWVATGISLWKKLKN